MPVNDCSPTKPKFRGKLVTANTQTEKTVHITASHINRILLERFIVHLCHLVHAIYKNAMNQKY
jgi:hypothetical protein